RNERDTYGRKAPALQSACEQTHGLHTERATGKQNDRPHAVLVEHRRELFGAKLQTRQRPHDATAEACMATGGGSSEPLIVQRRKSRKRQRDFGIERRVGVDT